MEVLQIQNLITLQHWLCLCTSVSSGMCQLQIWGKIQDPNAHNRRGRSNIHARCPACPFSTLSKSSIASLTTSKSGVDGPQFWTFKEWWCPHAEGWGIGTKHFEHRIGVVWNFSLTPCQHLGDACLLLPPDVQHLLHNKWAKSLAVTIDAEKWKVKTVMVHPYAYYYSWKLIR
jgi:hypothetical protein